MVTHSLTIGIRPNNSGFRSTLAFLQYQVSLRTVSHLQI
jgi:hypothetical protein